MLWRSTGGVHQCDGTLGTSFTPSREVAPPICDTVEILLTMTAGREATAKALLIAQDLGMVNKVLASRMQMIRRTIEQARKMLRQQLLFPRRIPICSPLAHSHDTSTAKGKARAFHQLKPI